MKKFFIFLMLISNIEISLAKINDLKNEKGAYFLKNPFFRLPCLKIPVIKEGKLVANVSIQFDMKAFGKESFFDAKILAPRLVDAIFRDLYGALQDRWFLENKISGETLSKRALEIANRVLNKDSVEMVFIKELFVSQT